MTAQLSPAEAARAAQRVERRKRQREGPFYITLSIFLAMFGVAFVIFGGDDMVFRVLGVIWAIGGTACAGGFWGIREADEIMDGWDETLTAWRETQDTLNKAVELLERARDVIK